MDGRRIFMISEVGPTAEVGSRKRDLTRRRRQREPEREIAERERERERRRGEPK
jgi:hypothetical protein